MIASMIFFPEKELYEKPEDYQYSYEEVWIDSGEGIKLHAWFLKPAGQAKAQIILYSHGNAGNMSGRLSKAKGWLDQGYSVMLYDYRGYGKSTGKMEKGGDIVRDAQAAFQWLEQAKDISPRNIILYGESLGSYVSVSLAVQYTVFALILEAPFTSFSELAAIHYPMFPKIMVQTMLKDFEFSNENQISQIKCPVFILHGTQDETCPYEMAERLFEKAPESKSFFTVEGGHHNDLPIAAGPDYWQKPLEFLTRL